MINSEPKLLDMLADPAYSGPNNSSEAALTEFFHLILYQELIGEELGKALFKWLGTYLIPSSPLTLPCPACLDLLGILDEVFNNLPARSLLQFLQEGKAMLEKTLVSVRAAPPERSDWIGELERLRAGLDEYIDRAAHNAKVEEHDAADGLEDYERLFCPICDKRFGRYLYCEHYFGYGYDGNEFGGSDGNPDFLDEVIQLNRTINRPKTKDAIFKVLLSEAPAEIGKLFQEVRKNGSSYWTKRDGVEFNEWENNALIASTRVHREYFHANPAEFVASIKEEAQVALDWLEAFHPEIMVKRNHQEEMYYDCYSRGYEGENRVEDYEEDFLEKFEEEYEED